MNDLDLELQKKLRAAAEAEATRSRSELDDARLVQILMQRSKPTTSRTKPLLALGLASAAALLLLFWQQTEPKLAVQPAIPAPACALPTDLQWLNDGQGKQKLALGRFGRLVASPDAQLAIERNDACLLTISLESGLLVGDLNSLKPAQLEVRTALGTVLVRGTRFSVQAVEAPGSTGERRTEQLEVVLVSGRVEIVGDDPRLLEPQHVYRRTLAAHSVSALRSEQDERISALLSESKARTPEPTPPIVVEPTRTARRPALNSTSLLERAERERRGGDLQRARALYGEASAYADENAEVALLRWVRLELQMRASRSADQLLTRHGSQFANGKLKAEAAWLKVQLLFQQGEQARASRAARELLQRFPGTPQADAAQAMLRAP